MFNSLTANLKQLTLSLTIYLSKISTAITSRVSMQVCHYKYIDSPELYYHIFNAGKGWLLITFSCHVVAYSVLVTTVAVDYFAV